MTKVTLLYIVVQICAIDQVSLCSDFGDCEDVGDGVYQCNCISGYTGEECATDINECDPNPCQNSGVCENRIAEYTCDCTDDYEGDNCTGLHML